MSESNAGSIYYEIPCGVPSSNAGSVIASGYDDLNNVFYTEANVAGAAGNNLFVNITPVEPLSSKNTTSAVIGGNGIYVETPYKKYISVQLIDAVTPANNFFAVLAYSAMFEGKPKYTGVRYSVQAISSIEWEITDSVTADISINESGQWAYPDLTTGGWTGTGTLSSSNISITAYDDTTNAITAAINGVVGKQLTVTNEDAGNYYPHGGSVIILSGGVDGFNPTSNISNNNSYLYKESNDYILWGQETTYPQLSTNIGTGYYFLECDFPSDVGLNLESNIGTKYYYSSAFNCVMFCDPL